VKNLFWKIHIFKLKSSSKSGEDLFLIWRTHFSGRKTAPKARLGRPSHHIFRQIRLIPANNSNYCILKVVSDDLNYDKINYQLAYYLEIVGF